MSRVLVPSDGSPNSLHGVRHVAKEFMKNRGLDIHVLNIQRPFSSEVARFTSRRDRMAFHQEQSEMALGPARQALDRSGIPYTVHTEVGDKADCIADAAPAASAMQSAM
ncbi:MAG: universal stress protein [Polaromonas sp.]|nr:universal stress protein [Polaromonas sp.]